MPLCSVPQVVLVMKGAKASLLLSPKQEALLLLLVVVVVIRHERPSPTRACLQQVSSGLPLCAVLEWVGCGSVC
jgi:hypothetical protein